MGQKSTSTILLEAVQISFGDDALAALKAAPMRINARLVSSDYALTDYIPVVNSVRSDSVHSGLAQPV